MIGLLAILCGCASNNQVVQNGIFQHRKYNHPGWFAEIAHHERHATSEARERTAEQPIENAEQQSIAKTEVPIERSAAPVVIIADHQAPVTSQVMKAPHAKRNNVETDQASLRAASITLEDVAKRTDRIFPAGSLLALSRVLVQPTPSDDVGGIDIFALLGFIFAFIFPIAGLVLSIIGLNRTRSGGRGHGLALAGLIISIVFIVVYGAVLLR